MKPDEHKRQVREGYEHVLERALDRTAPGAASEPSVTRAGALGYDGDAVSDLPDSAVGASFGCGNPLAFADVTPGETVVDIGSGAGLDCLVAGKAVGPTGRVIGVDMTPTMVATAATNARKAGSRNVDFRLGDAESLPVDDASTDWVISNCVINLTPDKPNVFQEIARVLKPGGRVSISDIVTTGPLPREVVESLDALVGCVAGAVDEQHYLTGLAGVGLEDVRVTDRVQLDPSALSGDDGCGCSCDCDCGDGCGPETGTETLDSVWTRHADALRGRVHSVRITARRPAE